MRLGLESDSSHYFCDLWLDLDSMSINWKTPPLLDIHKHPPLDIACVTSSTFQGGGGVIGPGHEHFAIGFQYREKLKGGGGSSSLSSPPPLDPPLDKKTQTKNRSRAPVVKLISAHWIAC